MPMPYLPTVKAMAPKAPMGAAFIKMATRRKIGEVSACRKSTTGRPRSPTSASAMPNSTEKNSTCRMSPCAKAPVMVSGMMFIRKPTMVVSCAFSVKVETFEASSVAGLMCMPAPGWMTFDTTRPTISANVEKTRK